MSDLVITLPSNDISVSLGSQDVGKVVVSPAPLGLTTVGQQGAAGPTGDSTLSHIAGETLSGGMAVRFNASGQFVKQSNDLLSDSTKYVGITKGAAINGTVASVQAAGEMTDAAWTWTPGGAIYLGANGLLTQTTPTAPTAAFVLILGYAISATSIFINPGMSIIL